MYEAHLVFVCMFVSGNPFFPGQYGSLIVHEHHLAGWGPTWGVGVRDMTVAYNA